MFSRLSPRKVMEQSPPGNASLDGLNMRGASVGNPINIALQDPIRVSFRKFAGFPVQGINHSGQKMDIRTFLYLQHTREKG